MASAPPPAPTAISLQVRECPETAVDAAGLRVPTLGKSPSGHSHGVPDRRGLID